MEALKALMRFFSYLFHVLLVLFLIAVSGVTMASGRPNLQLGMLPWTGFTLIHVLFFGSLFGLVTVILAMRGVLRVLFLLWSLAVAALLLKGYVFSGYRFAPDEYRTAAYLIGASLLALPGAWFQFRRQPKRRRH